MNNPTQNINIVVDLLNQCPGAKAAFSIFWAKGSLEWMQAGWENKDRKSLEPRLKQIIQNYSPDAIKVIIDPKLAHHNPQEHIIDITGKLSFMSTENQEKKPENGMSGDYSNMSGLGALQIENLNKNFEIKLLERDKDAMDKEKVSLETKIKELETENNVLYKEIGDLQAKGGNDKWASLLGIVIGKKVLGDDLDVNALMGLLGDSGEANINQTHQIESVRKSGGIEIEGDEPSKTIEIISAFLSHLEKNSNESFLKVISILQKFESDTSLIDTVLDLIIDKKH